MAFESTGGGNYGPDRVFRGQYQGQDENGKPIPVFTDLTWEEQKRTHVVPPTSEYDFKCIGFTEPKPDTKFAEEGKPPRIITNIELEIISERGKGAKCFWKWQTFRIGLDEKMPTNLGRVYLAGGGPPVEIGKQPYMDNLLNLEFRAYWTASRELNQEGKPKGGSISPETIQPVVAGGQAAYDPFQQAVAQAS